MPTHGNERAPQNQDDSPIVLDLDATPADLMHDAPESFMDKVKRCGNTRGSTPLPWPQLSVVMLVSLSEGVTSSILLPFVAFMVSDLFGYPEKDIGYYAGWLTSAYFLSQVFSSVLLGQLSDIKGRRPIILMGVIGNLVTTLIFGMARSFWLALLARFVCGMVNGNIGTLKSYIREITDETNQARAYTLRSSGYAIGAIVGPMVGGALARPALQYPNIFSASGIFGYFPFLLPCLFSILVSVISLTLGLLYLQETVKTSDPDEEQDYDVVDELELAEISDGEDKNNSSIVDVPAEYADPSLASDTSTPSSLTSPSSPTILSQAPTPTTSPAPSSESQNGDNIRVLSGPSSANDAAQVPLEVEDTEVPSALRLEKPQEKNKHSIVRSRRSEFWIFLQQLQSRLGVFRRALQEKDVVVSILLYAGVAFVQLGFDEVFAFWAIKSVADGGIAFSTLQIGTSHAISGVGMLAMQMFAYVPMDNALGTQRTLTVSMSILIPAFTLVSFSSVLVGRSALLWLAIGTVMVIKAGFGTTGFAAVNLLVSNAAGSETVGAVNGLSASTAAVARVLSPVLVGSVFAATSNSTVGFPFDYHFVFFCLAFIAALVSVCSHFGLPASINKRKA